MPKDARIYIGYKLSSEEFSAPKLVRYARLAEEYNFEFALISDHYHPWTDTQGESPFVWSVLGAIAEETRSIKIGTGVTCPTFRIHPAIIAQAAATTATLLPNRFFLGLGTGEKLNEHILGQRWPQTHVRQELLIEAIEIIRLLWRGGLKSFHGEFYSIENARVYSLPEILPPIIVAASGPKSAVIASKLGDGLISIEPNRDLTDLFKQENDSNLLYGEVNVCFDADKDRAQDIARKYWPISILPNSYLSELSLPSHFRGAENLATKEMIAQEITCGPDKNAHRAAIQKYIDAGFTHICIHQIGPNQEEFMKFYNESIIPYFST